MSDKGKQSLQQAANIFKNGFAKQLVMGSASGWLTGAVVGRAGKGVAVVLGSGIILYQIAHHQGFVKQDWDSLTQMAQQKSCEMSKASPTVQKVRVFAAKNRVFTAGFLGGFLIGIAL